MFHVDWATLVLRELDERVEPLDAALLDGAFDSLDAYREAVGRRRGMLEVRALMVSLIGDPQQDAHED
jgi:hypothetical protein